LAAFFLIALSILTNILSFIFATQIFNLIKITMLQSGYREGGGVVSIYLSKKLEINF
jgi:membrane glycosyltransferase